MKKTILILAIMSHLSAFSQEKGSKEILILMDKTDEHENYVSTLKAFISKGFEIDQKDDLFHTVTFEPIKYNFGYGKRKDTYWNYLIVNADFSGDSAIIRMQNKRSGKLKRATIYDPKYPETVAAFETIINVVSNLGKLKFPKQEGYTERPKGYRDDVYGN